MRVSRRMSVSTVTALFAIGALTFAVGASGHDRHGGAGGDVFRLMLTPSLHTDPAIHGVSPAAATGRSPRGAPVSRVEGRGDNQRHGSSWYTRSRSTGALQSLELQVDVEGLVLRGTSDPGPVKSIKASVFCASDSTQAFLSPSASLSARGDAELDVHVSPGKCLAPVVLIHPNGDTTHYIAVSGFGN